MLVVFTIIIAAVLSVFACILSENLVTRIAIVVLCASIVGSAFGLMNKYIETKRQNETDARIEQMRQVTIETFGSDRGFVYDKVAE
jgi:hypothetical protein